MDIQKLINQLEQAKEEGIKSVLIGVELNDAWEGGTYNDLQDIKSRTIAGDLIIFETSGNVNE